eukprot:3913367-Prymnesium_polylepis.3
MAPLVNVAALSSAARAPSATRGASLSTSLPRAVAADCGVFVVGEERDRNERRRRDSVAQSVHANAACELALKCFCGPRCITGTQDGRCPIRTSRH